MLKGHEIGGNYDHVYYAYARGVLDSIAEFVLNLSGRPLPWTLSKVNLGRLVLAPLYHRIRFETDAREFRIRASSLSADSIDYCRRRCNSIATLVSRHCKKSAWPLARRTEIMMILFFFFFITRPSSRKNPVHKICLCVVFFSLVMKIINVLQKNSIQSLSVKVSYPGCFSWIMYKSCR